MGPTTSIIPVELSAVPLPANFVAIDTETTGLNPWLGDRIFSAAAAFPSGRILYWRDDLAGLKELCEDPSIDKVFHNAKFDMRMLEWSGIRVRGRVHDTMVLAHLVYPGMSDETRVALSLESLCDRYLPAQFRKLVEPLEKWFEDHSIPKKRRGEHFADLPHEMCKLRCTTDAKYTLMLFRRLYPHVIKFHSFMYDIETRLIPVVKRMEDRGVEIDIPLAEYHIHRYGLMCDEVNEFFTELTGREYINLNSPKDVTEILDRAGLLSAITKRTDAGRVALDDDSLRKLHHPITAMLLVGRAAHKMRSTFLRGMIDRAVNGVIHPTFKQTGTITGRFSCTDPNLQNIPIDGARRTALTSDEAQEALELTGIEYAPRIKCIFKCRKGMGHMHADKSKVELVMLAHYGDDHMLMNALATEDIHSTICQAVFGEVTKGLRTRTKIVIFGLVYGAGVDLSARRMGTSVPEAITIRNRIGANMPGVGKISREWADQIRERGYIRTDHGRHHHVEPSKTYRCANRMCQGTAGDEMKTRMVAISDYLESRGLSDSVQLILNVHDDLATEMPIEMMPEIVPQLNRIMHEISIPFRLPVPSSCDTTITRWSDAKGVSWNERGEPVFNHTVTDWVAGDFSRSLNDDSGDGGA